ncbi:46184_t:CDS:2 [Gigaspora margarita]|uniref:46184_t:CDS:1 n=1 Tax=Gigaspora margarita TaxID=4874 RepID=A0ABM8W0J6_GIGMA|nr:46184_t:CDS:2 [Gigaspora margarita]
MAEIHKYPYEPNIYYKEKNRSFHYTIIEEGIYSLKYKYTFAQRRSQNQQTVKCAINYINNKPIFYIYFGDSFKNQVISEKSTSDAATLFHNKVTTLKSTQTSGVLLFGLQLNCIKNNREKKQHNSLKLVSEANIDDLDIIEQVTNAIGKAGYRDGRNVGRKIKHVMVTCAILDDKTNLYIPNHHYVVVLYPGSENYDSLKNAMLLFLNELHELKKLGIKINNITWNINLYFSADWKFLCICLGFNGANSYYYCPCKSMDQLNADFTIYNGHKNSPLFNMIPLDNWVIDKLHTMLKITDCLWHLVLNELQDDDLFNEFTPAKIRNLWNKFSQLYNNLRDNSTDPNVFEKAAKEYGNWEANEEVISGLYLPSDITPYMHVLIYYTAEIIQTHRHWGLRAFSCSAVEKKNHQQVSYFFRKTLKDGGKNKDEKLAIKDLLNYENRNLYFVYNDISCSSSKYQKIYIQ